MQGLNRHLEVLGTCQLVQADLGQAKPEAEFLPAVTTDAHGKAACMSGIVVQPSTFCASAHSTLYAVAMGIQTKATIVPCMENCEALQRQNSVARLHPMYILHVEVSCNLIT